jgi:hypothetical protein
VHFPEKPTKLQQFNTQADIIVLKPNFTTPASLAVVNKYYVLPFTIPFISSHRLLEFGIRPTDYIAGCLPISLSLSFRGGNCNNNSSHQTTTYVPLCDSLPIEYTYILMTALAASAQVFHDHLYVNAAEVFFTFFHILFSNL